MTRYLVEEVKFWWTCGICDASHSVICGWAKETQVDKEFFKSFAERNHHEFCPTCEGKKEDLEVNFENEPKEVKSSKLWLVWFAVVSVLLILGLIKYCS